MRKSIKILATAFIQLSAVAAFAQTDTLLTKDVEVIKAYQPSISEAFKITGSPKIVDTTSYTPVFDYKIQSTLVPVTKSIQKLPVVQLGNPPLGKSNTGYLRGGVGNAYTPYGEVLINTPPSKNTDFGIHLFHYSSQPSVKLTDDMRIKTPYSENMARLFVKNYSKKSVIEWDIRYDRNRFNYYGFADSDSSAIDTLLYQDTEKISSTLNKKQVFNNASTHVNFRNLATRTTFDYNIMLGYNYFWNSTGQRSHHGSYNGDFGIDKKEYKILLGSKIDYFYQDSMRNCYTQQISNHQFVVAEISPRAEYEKDSWYLQGGFNLGAIFDDDSSASFHISPEINIMYHPIPEILSLFAGSTGQILANDYQSMTKFNPYTDYNTEMKPSKEVISLFGGFKGKISRSIAYMLDVNYTITHNKPFFYLKETFYPNAPDEALNMFNVKYDDLNVLRFGGNIRYSSDNVTVSLLGNYYTGEAKNISPLTHLPSFDATLTSAVQATKKIKATLDARIIGERKGEVEICTYNYRPGTELLDAPVYTTEFRSLKTIFDINIGAEYEYIKNLNFTLDVKNLLNQNYEVWHGYNSQGILFLLGARYAF